MKRYYMIIGLLASSAISYAQEIGAVKPTTIELIFFQHDTGAQPSTTAAKSPLTNATPSTVYSYHSPEGIYLANKLTHLIEHTTVSDSNLGSRADQCLLTNYEGLLAPYNYWQHSNQYRLEEEGAKHLRSIKAKLQRKHLNQVLLHIAWTLPSNASASHVPFVFNSNTLSNDDINERLQHDIQGQVHITSGKNFDVKTHINLVENGQQHTFSASRRMKKNQLNYIDNERYGLLALISNS